MSSTTELIDWSTAEIWLGIAIRPSVAATADRPSSSGRPAATSAPNASSRITSVIGSESVSARWKSSLNDFDRALLADAPPNSSTLRLEWVCCTFATAARIGSIRSSSCESLPRRSNCTSAERPSLLSWPVLPAAYGDFTFVMYRFALTSRITSATAGLIAALSPDALACTRTLSVAVSGKPEWLAMRSPAPDWPVP